MSKKKKSSAQDLIDSLLDDSRNAGSGAPKPKAHGLPSLPQLKRDPKKQRAEEKPPEESIVFELDPNREPTKSLKIVGEDSSSGSVLTPSEVHRAPTLVVKGALPNRDLPDDSLKFDQLGTPDPTVGADKTMRIAAVKRTGQSAPPLDKKTSTEVRFGMGSMGGVKSMGSSGAAAVFTSAEASLKQSESLRIAQTRINELENELERMRRECEKLASAGETLRRRSDELQAKTESLESNTRESQKMHEEEKKVLRSQLTAKERENIDMRAKLEESETRLEANFKRIRVRERELEHRLEIVKMESQTLVSTKDEMIMRLKREIDQLRFETENGKVRSQELYNQYREKQETIGRVVRALRIALTILEGDEESQPTKKAE